MSDRQDVKRYYVIGKPDMVSASDYDRDIKALGAELMKAREKGVDWTINELMNDAAVEKEARRRVEAEKVEQAKTIEWLWKLLSHAREIAHGRWPITWPRPTSAPTEYEIRANFWRSVDAALKEK